MRCISKHSIFHKSIAPAATASARTQHRRHCSLADLGWAGTSVLPGTVHTSEQTQEDGECPCSSPHCFPSFLQCHCVGSHLTLHLTQQKPVDRAWGHRKVLPSTVFSLLICHLKLHRNVPILLLTQPRWKFTILISQPEMKVILRSVFKYKPYFREHTELPVKRRNGFQSLFPPFDPDKDHRADSEVKSIY